MVSIPRQLRLVQADTEKARKICDEISIEYGITQFATDNLIKFCGQFYSKMLTEREEILVQSSRSLSLAQGTGAFMRHRTPNFYMDRAINALSEIQPGVNGAKVQSWRRARGNVLQACAVTAYHVMGEIESIRDDWDDKHGPTKRAIEADLLGTDLWKQQHDDDQTSDTTGLQHHRQRLVADPQLLFANRDAYVRIRNLEIKAMKTGLLNCRLIFDQLMDSLEPGSNMSNIAANKLLSHIFQAPGPGKMAFSFLNSSTFEREIRCLLHYATRQQLAILHTQIGNAVSRAL